MKIFQDYDLHDSPLINMGIDFDNCSISMEIIVHDSGNKDPRLVKFVFQDVTNIQLSEISILQSSSIFRASTELTSGGYNVSMIILEGQGDKDFSLSFSYTNLLVN